jgi:hypothetical protein
MSMPKSQYSMRKQKKQKDFWQKTVCIGPWQKQKERMVSWSLQWSNRHDRKKESNSCMHNQSHNHSFFILRKQPNPQTKWFDIVINYYNQFFFLHASTRTNNKE